MAAPTIHGVTPVKTGVQFTPVQRISFAESDLPAGTASTDYLAVVGVWGGDLFASGNITALAPNAAASVRLGSDYKPSAYLWVIRKDAVSWPFVLEAGDQLPAAARIFVVRDWPEGVYTRNDLQRWTWHSGAWDWPSLASPPATAPKALYIGVTASCFIPGDLATVTATNGTTQYGGLTLVPDFTGFGDTLAVRWWSGVDSTGGTLPRSPAVPVYSPANPQRFGSTPYSEPNATAVGFPSVSPFITPVIPSVNAGLGFLVSSPT